VLRFLELKSIRENPPPGLMKRILAADGERFPLRAAQTGADPLSVQSASYMAAKYGDGGKEELRWLLLYLLDLSSQGHIRISAEDIRDDFPLWAGTAYAGADRLYGRLTGLIGENPRLFSPLEKEGAAVLYDRDRTFFYLLKKRRFELRFLDLLKGMTGPDGVMNPGDGFEERVRNSFENLSRSSEYPLTAESLQAALMVSRSRLSVITGGPGTGKTTILGGLLRIFLEACTAGDVPLPEIRLCAPTGRAAKRMSESLDSLIQDIRFSRAFAHPAQTIHKVLGLRPGVSAVYHELRTLGADILVVDEASMVDLNLMSSLLRAMKPEARLVLVGDRDQLPSVEAGALLSDLLHEKDRSGHRLEDRVLSLSKVHRNSGAILESSKLIIRGESDALLTFLKGASSSGDTGRVYFNPIPAYRDLLDRLAEEYRSQGTGFGGKGFTCPSREWRDHLDEIAAYFRLFRSRIILGPSRKGLYGTVSINRGLNDALGGTADADYHGQPLLVTRNDYERTLFNGDRGVVLRFDDGFFAFFEDPRTGYRPVPLQLLENRESSFALTIHKSQGSEYDFVHIIMPEGVERLISREILYTAVTRAKKGVHLYGSEDVVRLALSRKVRRLSGIRDFMLQT